MESSNDSQQPERNSALTDIQSPPQPHIILLLRSEEDRQAAALPEELRRLEAEFTLLSSRHYVSIRELQTLLDGASHVVGLFTPEALAIPEKSFVFGYAAGRGLPLHLLVPEGTALPDLPSNANVAREAGELIAGLREELERWREEQVRLAAIRAIEERGLPPTEEGLAQAVTRGLAEMIELFLLAGFSVDTHSLRGIPLLCIAARAGFDEIFFQLLEHGAEVNTVSRDRGNTPLMDAAAENNTELVRACIDAGAELDVQSKNGQSALILAVGQKLEGVAKLLVTAGANPDLQDQLGMSARAYARLFKLEGLLELMDSA